MTSKALKLACCECAHPIIYRRIKVSSKVALSYEKTHNFPPCMTDSRKAISYATLVKTTPIELLGIQSMCLANPKL